jgi:hypothetical protein
MIVTDFSPTVNFISLRIGGRVTMALLSVMSFSTNAQQKKVQSYVRVILQLMLKYIYGR